MNYDLNLTKCGQMAKQTIDLTFQVETYRATQTTTVSGNVTGLDAIRQAVEQIFEDLGGEDGCLTLSNEQGETTNIELWEFELSEVLVEARIIAISPEVDTPFDENRLEHNDAPPLALSDWQRFDDPSGGYSTAEEEISAESVPLARAHSSNPATFEPLGGSSLPT